MNTDRIFLVLVPAIRPLVAAAARQRRRQFEAAPQAAGRVVFLGDSIIEQGLGVLAPGYRAWTDVLRPHLAAFATQP